MFPGDWTEGLARLFGESVAVVDEASGERISYRALAWRAGACAAALVELGVRRSNASEPGPRVAVLAKNRVEHLELLFACARLGAIFLPINWRLAEPEVGYILDDAAPTVLLYDEAFAEVAQRLASARGLRALSLDADLPRLHKSKGALPVVPQAALSEHDPWLVLYTSGTTGYPKGALIPYRQVAYNALNTSVALDLTSKDKTVTYTPLFHTGGLHVLTTPLLLRGGTIILADGFEPARFLKQNAAERCTLLFGVPTTFEMMAASASFEGTDLSSLRLALCGGAPCPLSLIERYTARGIVFKQGYGLTEVGPNVLNLNAEDVVKKAGSAGRPNLFISARVIDAEGRVVTGAGRGELCLGGPCVCLGYWNKPEATRASFTADGFFKTGDVVEVDSDGFMSIVDRAKDMFISGGENVYPAEVEKVLADHPAVRAAAVVGIADARWGEVGRAYLELRGSQRIDVAEVVRFARARLAAYKVPKDVVVVDELPKNPSGKVQKHLLSREVRA
ncbi:MAG: AMP-binding protein [Deltaproteobacteria bacterium]|nr:AMP-binding protein [Deltaproteobacteria bacterium]